MLSEFQKVKIAKMFTLYDTDGNGYIEATDFKLLVDRLAEDKGIDKESDEYRELHDAILGGDWGSLRQLADVDQDDRISLDEYYATMDKLLMQMPKAVIAGSFAKRIFDWTNADSNEEIDLGEFQSFIRHYGVPDEESAEAFARLDRDGDGHWTLSECIQDVQDFLYSENKDAPGNWLLGKL
jgi:Ca2+-binding EF-hand superfamily protein